MSMSLTALPSEIIGCVVANLTSQPTSLCNLARCSRQLYLCTVPHLYRHVTIHEEIRNAEQQDGQLKKLASSLIRRPDLAVLVRYFTVHVNRISGPEASYPEEPTSEKYVRPNMVTLDQAFTFSREEKINYLGQFSLTHELHYDFILALLLPALLKMEKLVTDVNNGPYASYMENVDGTYYLEQVIQRAARTERSFEVQLPFGRLTVVAHPQGMFESCNTGHTAGLTASLLKLPAIQEISGGFQSTWDRCLNRFGVTDKNLIELESFSSPVTTLNLVDCRLSRVDLGHILRAPKGLKAFYYLLRPSASAFTDIRHALVPQKNCLEILGLSCFDADAGNNKVFEPMISFISFNALKVFKTAASFLITTENGTGRHNLINIFPPNLETLHITYFQSISKERIVLEALEHLLSQKSPQQIPALKKLILEESGFLADDNPFAHFGYILWEETQETVIQRLCRVAAAHGVSIDVTKASTDVELSDE
ncbi:hypothetical protein MMC22_008826 [Lobaria immixta]|nr:hypothetical protein [Lobaria immixta]